MKKEEGEGEGKDEEALLAGVRDQIRRGREVMKREVMKEERKGRNGHPMDEIKNDVGQGGQAEFQYIPTSPPSHRGRGPSESRGL
jgi:hypothetical protein